MAKPTNCCARNWLMISTTIAVIVGIGLGIGLRYLNLNADIIAWIQIWGELFIRMFSAVALPLIFCCIIVGITGMQGRTSGALGLAIVIYMLITITLCIVQPVCLHLIMRPLKRHAAQSYHISSSGTSASDSVTQPSYTDLFTDILRNLIPDNIVSASLETVYTVRRMEERTYTSGNTTNTEMVEVKDLERRYGFNSLGMVMIAMVIAVAMNKQGPRARPLKSVFTSMSKVLLSVIDIILWYSPFGVCCLIAGALVTEKHLLGALFAVLFFVIEVITALIVHSLILLPLLYVAIVRKNPFALYGRCVDALMAGFAPPSNIITMTVLLDRAERRFDVKTEVAAFVMPIVVVFIKHGSAIFITASVLFMAESQDVQLSLLSIVMIGCLVAIITTSVPNIPSGSILVIVLVCSTLHLPVHTRLGLLFTVEWLLDRIRTSVNGVALIFGVPIINKLASYFSDEISLVADNEHDITTKEKLLSNDFLIDINGNANVTNFIDEFDDGPETAV